jgi:S1-C subfamily serine protease
MEKRMTERITEPALTRTDLWRGRLQRLFTRVRSAGLFAAGVVAALAALLLYNALTPQPHQLTLQEVNDTVVQVMASATPPPAFSAQVYQAVWPSLVLIEVQALDANGQPEEGFGSGVIVDDTGVILTSLHVITNATTLQITFADGTQSGAIVLTTQPEKDIAVLAATQLPDLLVPATLGNPNAMRVGDEVFVMGNPFGLYSSMSAGVISGFDRTFSPTASTQQLEGLIQIDAAVNPGNSGGPLLNRYGHVVGIITGLVNPTEQDVFIGIGFAVPIDVAAEAAGLPPH